MFMYIEAEIKFTSFKVNYISIQLNLLFILLTLSYISVINKIFPCEHLFNKFKWIVISKRKDNSKIHCLLENSSTEYPYIHETCRSQIEISKNAVGEV